MVEHDYLQVLKLLVLTPNICVEKMLKELFWAHFFGLTVPKQVLVRQQNCFYPQRNSQLHIADTNTQTVSSLLIH